MVTENDDNEQFCYRLQSVGTHLEWRTLIYMQSRRPRPSPRSLRPFYPTGIGELCFRLLYGDTAGGWCILLCAVSPNWIALISRLT